MEELVDISKKKSRSNSERSKEWRLKNRERLLEYCKNWNKENADRLKEYRQINKEKFNKISRDWQKENREKAYAAHRRYRDKDREKINLISKISREKNKDERLERRRNRSTQRRNDEPIYKFGDTIRALVSHSFRRGSRNFKKNTKTEEILGCSIPFFIDYILKLCPKGIGVCDFKRYGYHIDHIIPLNIAKNEEDIIKLCHYTNLQPLWWRDNIIKRDKIIN